MDATAFCDRELKASLEARTAWVIFAVALSPAAPHEQPVTPVVVRYQHQHQHQRQHHSPQTHCPFIAGETWTIGFR
jgi:hypothetical protein